MQVVFTPPARAELVDAQDWYEAKHPVLGTRFREEVESTILRLQENPHQFPIVFFEMCIVHVCVNFLTVSSSALKLTLL